MVAGQDVVGVELPGVEHPDAGGVAQALAGQLVFGADHDEDRPGQPWPGHAYRGAQHREGALGAGLLAVDERAHHRDPAVAHPVRQRPAQRGRLHLLRRALLVRTGYRPVHDTAARVLRRAERALPGPPGALLAVRLLATTADHAARLGGVRALPGRRLLGHHDLVHERDVDARLEDLPGELDVRAALA